MNCTRKITASQAKALAWLNDHGGDGAFIQCGQNILAQDTTSPYKRDVWVALRDAGRVEFYSGPGRGYGRIRVKK